jgi:hypothetical protein
LGRSPGQPGSCPGRRNITGICWKYGVEQIFKQYWFEGAQIYSLPGAQKHHWNMVLNKYLKNIGLKGRKFIACSGSRNITGICWKYGVEQIFKEYWFEGAQIYSLPGAPTCLGPVLYIPSDKY